MPTPIPAFAGLEKNACLQQTGTHYFRNVNIYVGEKNKQMRMASARKTIEQLEKS